jgi:hypothetical protein
LLCVKIQGIQASLYHYMNKILSFVAVVLVFIIGAQLVSAQANTNLCTSGTAVNELKGWVWSDTTGWISMSSANGVGGGSYKVCVDASGNMGGYAWAPNAGWISFEPGDAVGCPTSAAPKVDLAVGANKGKVSGYAKARTGGNCIELAGPLHLSAPGANNGVFMDPASGAFSGMAWASGGIGWMSFNVPGTDDVICTNNCDTTTVTTPPTCTLTANPATLPAGGGSATLTWTSADATACAGNGFVTGNATAGNVSVNVTANSNYSLSCTNAAYTTPQMCAAAAVTVTPPATSNVNIWIGRTVASANAIALAVTKGDSFALKWSNDAAVGVACTASVTRDGAAQTAANWSPWLNQNSTPENLRTGTASAFPVTTNSTNASGVYKFILSCDNGSSDSVDLVLNSSTQIEI